MPNKYIFTATKKNDKYYIMYLFCLQKSYDAGFLPKIQFNDIKDKNNKPILYNLEPSTPNENSNTVNTGSISTTKLPTEIPTIKLINNSKTIVTFSEENLKLSTVELNNANKLYDEELNNALQFIIDYLKQKKTDYEKEIGLEAKKIETLNSAAKKKEIEDQITKIENLNSEFIINYLKDKKKEIEDKKAEIKPKETEIETKKKVIDAKKIEIKAIKIEDQKKEIEDQIKEIDAQIKVIEEEIEPKKNEINVINTHINNIDTYIKERTITKIKADDNIFKAIKEKADYNLNKAIEKKQTADDDLFKAIKNKKDVDLNYEKNLAEAQSKFNSVTKNPKSSKSDKDTASKEFEAAKGAKTSAEKKLKEAQYAKKSANEKLVKEQDAKTLIDNNLIYEKWNTQKAINDDIYKFNIDDLPSADIQANFKIAINKILNKETVVTANNELTKIITDKSSIDTIFKEIKEQSAEKFMKFYKLSDVNKEWETYFDSYYYRPQLFLLEEDINDKSNISITINGLNNSNPINIPTDNNIQIIQIDDFFKPRSCLMC